jgi:hypothetical protein
VWRRLGFAASLAVERVAVSPACGQSGVPMAAARAQLASCRDAARRLRDDAEA